MLIFDGHNDTLTRFYGFDAESVQDFFKENESGHIDLPRARQGGLGGAFFAIFTPPPPGSPERDPLYGVIFTEDGYITAQSQPIEQSYAEDYTDAVIGYAYRLEEESEGSVEIIKSYAALE